MRARVCVYLCVRLLNIHINEVLNQMTLHIEINTRKI